jgi:GH15 family glucan-1,4-alpha-glucosidase
MVMNLWLIGRKADAEQLFERLLALRNDVGLLSEEWDAKANRMVGNFPQAFSHITLAHAAYTLTGGWVPQHAREKAGSDGKSR